MKPSLMKKNILQVFNFLRKHGAWVIFGKVFVSLLSLLLSVILAKFMTTQEYGSYQYYLSVFLLLGSFSIPGATKSVIKYVALGYEWTYQRLLKLRLRYSLLASIIFIVLSLYNIYVNNTIEAIVYFVFALIFPFYHSYDLFAYYLHAKVELKRLNTIYVVRAVVQVLSTVIVYFLSQSVELALITFIASIAIINTAIYYKVCPGVSRQMYEEDISYKAKKMAIGLSLVGILTIIVGQIDKILVFNLINPESLAVYGVGMMIGMTINSMFKVILNSFHAKLVVHDLKQWHYITVLFFGTLVGILVSMIIPYFVELLYGNTYKESAYYASIVLCSLGIYLVNNLFYDSNMLHRNKNVKSNYTSDIGVSCIQLVVISALFWFVSGDNILIYLPFIYTLKMLLSVLLIHVANLKMQAYEK